MNVRVAPGKYILAVSGGVDSMVLLDVLRRLAGVELVVAHFDHGIRPDSKKDREFVGRVARTNNQPYIYDSGNLGAAASEATARDARYAFLRRAQREWGAQAIVTAHHQDDALETAILNLLRGTGRKGLSALQSRPDILRPLLHVTKQEIAAYAHAHKLTWREDSTNTDTRYLRNYIRHAIVPRLGDTGRQKLLKTIERTEAMNAHIDAALALLLPAKGVPFERYVFIMLPHTLAREMMAAWLRQNQVSGFDRKTIERLVVFAKTALPNKHADIDGHWQLKAGKITLKITPRHLS